MKIPIVFLLAMALVGCAQAQPVLPATPDLTLQSVAPEKVFYKPGEVINVKVEISNPTSAPVTARLKIELVRDLDTSLVLQDAPISLEARATKSVQVSTKAEAWLGIEARATLSRDGKALGSKSEVFTCAPTVHQVLVTGIGNALMTGKVDANRDATAAYVAKFIRSSYGNYYEHFAWAPSDYDDMTPDTEKWWAGQAQYNESKTTMLAFNKVLAAQGTQVISYGKAGGAGPLSYEFFRKRPEWVIYFDGRPSIENYDAAFLDFFSAIKTPLEGDTRAVPGTPEEMEKAGYKGAGWFAPYTKGGSMFGPVWYDSNNDDVINHGSEQMGLSAQQLGLQGVRFDGEYFTLRHQLLDGTWNSLPNFDSDAADARLVQNMKKWTWALKPNYLFGYNTGLNFRWNVAANNTPQQFREKCKDDGLIAREELSFPGNVPWDDYIKVVRHDSDLVRFYGGHLAAYPFFRNPRVLYSYIIPSALRAHQMIGFVGTPVPGQPMAFKPEFSRFLTRNAAFLWDKGVHSWAQAQNEITATADRPLWWKSFAAVRPTNNGKTTQFLVHLINPPQSKTTLGDNGDLDSEKVPADLMPAAAAKNVEVRWLKPRNFKRAFVTDLSRNDFQPVTVRTEGKELVFSLPEINYWSILVIEADTPTPAAVWTTSKEEANLKLPSAQELGLAPSQGETGKRCQRF